MSLRLVTPGAPLVTTTEAKAHLRVFHEDDDSYIDGLIAAATDWIVGEKSWLGISSSASQYELTQTSFPSGRIDLPKPPLASVEGVFYTPSDGGAEQEITDFRPIGVGVRDGGYILPAKNTTWPDTDNEPGSVRITFTAGAGSVPASIKHAALLLVGHWYENREAAGDVKISELPMAVDALLFPYRNWQL